MIASRVCLQSTAKKTFNDMCESVDNDLVYWKHYIKSEVANSIADVWEDAQQDISGFLDDWK